MFDISTIDLSVVPIITAVIEVIKKLNIVNEKFLPLFALGFGIIGAFALNIGTTISIKIIVGLIIGLASSGFYSWSKTATGK
jgi:hypothetical protein